MAYSIACWRWHLYVCNSGQQVSNKIAGSTSDLWRSYLSILFNAIVQTISVPSSKHIIAANQYSGLFFVEAAVIILRVDKTTITQLIY
jgi:hypothetical protein